MTDGQASSTSLAGPPVSQKAGMAAALGSHAFRVLWLSETLSLVGDRILTVALINLVYEQSGSAAAVGLLAMIKALPALVLGALAGVFVDRWSRKWIMVLSNLALFALVFAIPLVPGLPLVFGVYFAMSVVSQFFIPARSATIPNLVPGGALVAANALFAAAFVGAIAIGPAIGGWIIDRYGLETAFYIDAITFLAPAVAVGLLAIPSGVRQASRRNMGADWREGFGLVKTESTFRTALILLASASLVIAALSTLGIVIVREKLGGSPGDFGWMMSVSGLGMLSGALLSTRLGTRFDSQRLASCGAGLAGVGLLGMALSPILPLVMGFGFVLGVGMITVQVQTQTTLQGAPDALRGRMLGIAQSVMGSMTFLIAGLAGLLAARFGATLVVLMCGLLAAGTGLAVFASSAQRG